MCHGSFQLLLHILRQRKLKSVVNRLIKQLNICSFLDMCERSLRYGLCYVTLKPQLKETSQQVNDLGVPGVWERSLPSEVVGPSLFSSRLVPPCSSVPGCLAEGSRPDINSMLCFKLSSLSYSKDKDNDKLFIFSNLDQERKLNHRRQTFTPDKLVNCCLVMMMQYFLTVRTI